MWVISSLLFFLPFFNNFFERREERERERKSELNNNSLKTFSKLFDWIDLETFEYHITTYPMWFRMIDEQTLNQPSVATSSKMDQSEDEPFDG